MKFVNIKDINESSWDDFVYKHPNGNFFQTKHYYQINSNIRNNSPIGYAVMNDSEILGIIIGIIYKNYNWPFTLFTKRTIVVGGPLIKDNRQDVFNLLIENFTLMFKSKCVYIQFRNLWDVKVDRYCFDKFGYLFDDHLDIIHDLTQSVDDLKLKISKGKRGNIHKSSKRGITFSQINSSEQFEKGIDLIFSTYNRIGLPCPQKEYFRNVYNKYNNTPFIKSFGAFLGDELISIRIEICYKNLVYDWYTGFDLKYKDKYPNDFLPYHILLWSKENGYTKFDFGGAGKPNVPYGVREHKLKFGGELVSYGRYEKVNKPFLMYFIKLGFLFFKISKDNKA